MLVWGGDNTSRIELSPQVVFLYVLAGLLRLVNLEMQMPREGFSLFVNGDADETDSGCERIAGGLVDDGTGTDAGGCGADDAVAGGSGG